MRHQITTWQQGKFIDNPRYRNWTDEMKQKADTEESYLVRPSALGNAICKTVYPEDAIWIADRLNFAANIREDVEDILLSDEMPGTKLKMIERLITPPHETK